MCLAAENARLLNELQWATAERQRLRDELHDRAQSRLVALQIRLGLAQERVQYLAPDVATLLGELGDQVEAVNEELRRVAHGVYPPALAAHGLVAALMAEARLAGASVRILAGPVGFSTPAVELAVYLCCLEAMQNAAKHAGRDVDVTIRLIHDEDELQFSVEDDGRGFDPTATECSGLATMRERIAAMGGRLTVSSVRGQGTTVSGAVRWPARTHESVSAHG